MPYEVEHGTATMYRYGCRCDECKAAKAKQRAEYTERKKSGDFIAKKDKKPKLPICEPLALCMARDFRIPHEIIGEVFGCNATTITKRLHILGHKPGKGSRNKFSSTEPLRSHTHCNRARRYGVPYEYGITLKRVYERDGGICYLCGRATSFNDLYITDEGYFVSGHTYPTIDHVVPMSKGGGHVWSNVRLACHQCNSAKGDRLLFEPKGACKS